MSYTWSCGHCKVKLLAATTGTPDGWHWRLLLETFTFIIFCRRCLSGGLDVGITIEPQT